MKFSSIKSFVILLVGLIGLLSACKDTQQSTSTTSTTEGVLTVTAPSFNEDSALQFVQKQVDFGARIPNSKAHQQCGDYLINTLKQYGWQVTQQAFDAKNYKGEVLKSRNIIGSYRPEMKKRILLTSHWDSRPWADQEEEQSKKPVPAANDGASGVGVLLEIARVLSQQPDSLALGVDIIFFDAEDSGNSDEANDEYSGYCLGSQYWAANKHQANYSAYFGILLDMVGAPNATFPKEGISRQYAGEVVKKVWGTASQLGYDRYFINVDGPGITDDHLPVNKMAKIPMIDIVHLEVNHTDRTFFEHWHTTQDTMENISSATLKAVGQTVLQVLYNEAN
jgi:hypothetical protein